MTYFQRMVRKILALLLMAVVPLQGWAAPSAERARTRLEKMHDLSTLDGLRDLHAAAALEGDADATALATVAAIETLGPVEGPLLRAGLSERVGEENVASVEKSLAAARGAAGSNEELRLALSAVQSSARKGSASEIIAHLDRLYEGRAASDEPAPLGVGWKYEDSLPAALSKLHPAPDEFDAEFPARQIRALDASFGLAIARQAPELDASAAPVLISGEAVFPAIVQPFLHSRTHELSTGELVPDLARRIADGALAGLPGGIERAALWLEQPAVTHPLQALVDRMNDLIRYSAAAPPADELAAEYRHTAILGELRPGFRDAALDTAMSELRHEMSGPSAPQIETLLRAVSAMTTVSKELRPAEGGPARLHWAVEGDTVRAAVQFPGQLSKSDEEDLEQALEGEPGLSAHSAMLRDAASEVHELGGELYFERFEDRTVLRLEWTHDERIPETGPTTPLAAMPEVETASEAAVPAGRTLGQEVLDLANAAVATNASAAVTTSSTRQVLDIARGLDPEKAPDELEPALRMLLSHFLKQFDADRASNGEPQRITQELLSEYERLLRARPGLVDTKLAELLQQGFSIKFKNEDVEGNAAVGAMMRRLVGLSEAMRPSLARTPGALEPLLAVTQALRADRRSEFVQAHLDRPSGGDLVATFFGIAFIANLAYLVLGMVGGIVLDITIGLRRLFDIWPSSFPEYVVSSWWYYFTWGSSIAIVLGQAIYVIAGPMRRSVTHSPFRDELGRWGSFYSELARENALQTEPFEFVSAIVTKHPQLLSKIGPDLFDEKTAKIPEEKAQDAISLIVREGSGGRWYLKSEEYREAFRRLSINVMNNEPLFEKWYPRTLDKIADIDPELFAPIAAQAPDDKVLGVLRLLATTDSAYWAFKNEAYRDVFRELAPRAPLAEVLPLAADLDAQTFLELCPKETPREKAWELLMLTVRSDGPRWKLKDEGYRDLFHHLAAQAPPERVAAVARDIDATAISSDSK